jgi:hypothetical protein
VKNANTLDHAKKLKACHGQAGVTMESSTQTRTIFVAGEKGKKMKLINYEEFKRLLLEERGKIPLTVPCATYELRKEKPNIKGQFIKHGIRIALRCLERCQDITTDISTIEQPQWISCAERLPKGGEIVFCNTNNYFEVLQWDARADVWVGMYRSYWKEYVTHWMPLPKPPKEDE